MKLDVVMCHASLMAMLLLPEKFSKAVSSFEATSPDMDGEGFSGYMEVKVKFVIKDLDAFNTLWKESYVFPSDRTKWYHTIKSGMLACSQN